MCIRDRRKGVEFCRNAKAMGADLALFPEMWNNGYSLSYDMEVMERNSEDQDGLFVNTFKELAAELEMAIAVTYLEKYKPLPRNTVTVFDRHGRNVLTYAKDVYKRQDRMYMPEAMKSSPFSADGR